MLSNRPPQLIRLDESAFRRLAGDEPASVDGRRVEIVLADIGIMSLPRRRRNGRVGK